MRFRTVVLFCLLSLLLISTAEAKKPVSALPAAIPVTDEAQRIYGKFGDAIYQVQTIDLTSGKKSSIGSGFQFAEDGLIATNYHVVASAIRHPQGNRLEYIHDHGGKGALKIVGVDVIHDLAILKMDSPGKTFLTLGHSGLPKGAKIFSLGNPHDIGFTIIEGTYNGLSKESFVDKIHFSGSLNPGMSGGPALSHDGHVVGVNVSTAGNQISFLVPVEPLRVLVEGLQKKGEEYNFLSQADADIGAQLLKGQQSNIDILLQKKWESVPFGPLKVPGRIHDTLKCWGVPVHEEKDPFRYYRSICATQDRVFLDEDFDTGTYSYRYDYITGTNKMDIFRFYTFYEQQYGSPAGEGAGREDDLTNFDCNTQFVDLAARRWKSSFCVRRYKRYPDIYDLQLYMAMVGTSKEGMIISLEAQGVSKDNALALAKRFMSEIKQGSPPKATEGKTP
jgi:hypothetical protein